MDWDKLRVFHAVAEAGSFTHAGERLTLSQSAVSRQISTLENSLKVKLFHRHARGLKLTEQGEHLFETAHEVFAKLAMAEARIADVKEKPQGPLKITTTVAFGSIWLTPRIKEFVGLYPEIDVSLVLADTELDLSMREADAAIRMMPPTQPDLIQRHLMKMNYRNYAAPEYLEARGMPKTVEDLDHHSIIVYGEDATPPVGNLNLLLNAGIKSGPPREPILRVNSIYGIYRAVRSGLGIAALPEYMSREGRNLVEVLPEIPGSSLDVYFVYPEELRKSKRIGVLGDFLARRMAGGVA
ncbi:MAG: LysR family transcriptional regulator [Proteobacteria bacterium]|nr:LysR family transcriptional regulator [Pseudomonadota bacterium]